MKTFKCQFLYQNRHGRLVCQKANNKKVIARSKNGQPYFVMVADCDDCPKIEVKNSWR